MGRKRKIPEGYMPRWDSDTDSSGGEQGHSSAMTSDRLPTDTRTSDTKGSVKKKKLPVEEEGQAMQVPPDGLVQEMFETQTEDKAPSTTSQPTSQPSSEEDFQGLVIQVSDDATINDVSQSPLYQTLFSPDYTEAQEQQVDNLEPQELWFDDYYEDEEDNDDDDEEEHDEEDEENKESFNYLFRRFAEDWTTAEVNHRVSKRASAGFWNVARKWMLSLTAAFNKDRKKKFPKYHHTRKKITEEKVPPISLDIGYVHKETGELSIVKDSDKNPIHKFPPDVYEKVYEIGSIKAEDIIKVHSKVCPSAQTKHIQCSLDGVSEAKSNSISLDVYSTKFRNCRYVYPHRIIRPLKKGFVDNYEQLKKVLGDLSCNDLWLDHFIADNPKRAFLRFCLNHNALFPCEYCFAKGIRFTIKQPNSGNKTDKTKSALLAKIKNLENQKKSEKNDATITFLKTLLMDIEKCEKTRSSQITVWPTSTNNKELRTKEKMAEIVSLIEENQRSEDTDPLTRDEVKGVVGESPLLKLEYFDFVNDITTEYMHLVCLGVVKRLTELTFNVGINRTRITNRKLSSTKLFNTLMAETKNVFEFSRRSRDLDFAVYKAEEFRNLILFYVPHVLECIENNAKERAVWLYLCFMIRACTLPDNEYFNVNVNQISTACTKFYKIYEQLFGPSNCTYSTHVLSCHLLQMRLLGPLTETSAFKFESFYGELRNAFTPGTPSTVKQMFESIILKRSLSPHSCEKSTVIYNYDTARQCNSLVYTYTNDNVNIYKVLDENDDVVICHPQGKFPCDFPETPELNWSSVGVFKKGASSTDVVKVQKTLIAGKVLKVGEYLITCPENVLKEK